jgi:predicted small lipoprotein YifL
MKYLILTIALLLIASCGIKGDLVRPSEIPNIEKQMEKNRGSLPL